MSLRRIHPPELVSGILGLALLASLLLPWSAGGEAALASAGPLDIVLLLFAAGAIAVPVIVAASRRTNVPVVYETMLWVLSLPVLLVLVVKLFFPPDPGFGSGFWIALAGTFGLGFSLWRSVAREH